MAVRWIWIAGMLASGFWTNLSAQDSEPDSSFYLTAIVYQEDFRPLPASHVVNLQTREGTITDSLGIFRLPVRMSDTLLVRNIAFHHMLIPVRAVARQHYVVMRDKYYDLQEVKVFEWGSSYAEFKDAVVHMESEESLGESLGLPQQDPGYVPREMKKEEVSSLGYLISSPVSFFYQNFSRHAKSERKAYWLLKDREKQEAFNKTVSRENIASITGLEGEDLERFIQYLNEQMTCDYNCSELQIFSEMHRLWDIYRSHRLSTPSSGNVPW